MGNPKDRLRPGRLQGNYTGILEEIPIQDVFASLIGSTLENESWQYIIQDYRLPKAFTAILVGSGILAESMLATDKA